MFATLCVLDFQRTTATTMVAHSMGVLATQAMHPWQTDLVGMVIQPDVDTIHKGRCITVERQIADKVGGAKRH